MDDREEERPVPEQFLKQIKKEGKTRGKLKIFFGACAGVGKTYDMLSEAQAKFRDNVDVVAGIIETHGRPETAKLLEGIPLLPLKEIEYKGIKIRDLDLDAAITRKPAILLVDELAHTNVIGSRHPKRWQDVLELLEAGIDVYTTLNVQHLESLNDMVANITGIRIKETVPDSIFDNADEIVLVDIPSEMIIERLREGKVYLGEFAKQRAANHFFKIENLIALREIALRRTAERVDALRDIYKKYEKKASIADKILVCIGPPALATKVVRMSKQLTTRLKSPWTVLHVEDDAYYRLTKEEQGIIQKTLHLAEQLGAKVQTLQDPYTVKAIMNFARENNFTKIILGKLVKSLWHRLWHRSMVNAIVDESGNIDVYIITEDTAKPAAHTRVTHQPWVSYVYSIIIILTCTLLGLPVREWLEPENFAMVYLAGIVIISLTFEREAALLAVVLSVIMYNFFFFYPYYTFASYQFKDLVTLSVLLLTGTVISIQTSRLRQQILFSRQREKFRAELYDLSRKLIATSSKSKIAKVVSHHIGEIFEGAATVWLPDEFGELELVSHPGIKPELKEESVVLWAFKHNQSAGQGTNTLPSARGYYLPLSSGETVLGVLGIIPKDPDKSFSVEDNMLLESLAKQTAVALERIKITEEMQKSKESKTL